MAQDVLSRRCVGQQVGESGRNLVVGRRRRDVSSGGAARLPRDRSVEDERRHTRGKRFERRQSESFVFGEECENRCAPVQGRQNGVIDVRTDVDAIGVPAAPSNRFEIDWRLRPVFTNDFEARITHAIGNKIESVE